MGTFLWASVYRSDFRKNSRGREIGEPASQPAPGLIRFSDDAHMSRHGSDRCRTFFSVAEPKKEKTEQNANGAISPSGCGGGGGGEPQAANLGTATTGLAVPVPGPAPDAGNQQKPNRPNTLDPRVVARRLILFDSEYTLASRRAYAFCYSSRVACRHRSEKSSAKSTEACIDQNDFTTKGEILEIVSVNRERERGLEERG